MPMARYSMGKWIMRNSDAEAECCLNRRDISHLLLAARGLRYQRGTPEGCLELADLIARQSGEVEFHQWLLSFIGA